MSSWTMPLQRATYRGVQFEVINITDNFERALAEHAYPFVNGADVEDMGLQPRRVQLQAVFFGKGYRIALDNLMVALQQFGADVLVHPIFGRMPNMVCASASLRHGDEFVDYVALDLTFIEASETQPIFVFENSFWGEVDRLLNELETFSDSVIALYGGLMRAVALGYHAKSRLLKVWSALVGIYESVGLLFDVDKQKFHLSKAVSLPLFESKAVKAIKELDTMIQQELATRLHSSTGASSQTNLSERNALFVENEQQNDLSVFTVRSRFDELLANVNQLNALPDELVTGKNDSVTRSAMLKSLIASFAKKEMQETACALRLLTVASLVRMGVELIEQNVENLSPADIEYLHHHIRLNLAAALESVRALQQQEMTTLQASDNPNTALYTQSYQTIEHIRRLAQGVSQLAVSAINRKPPLRVRTCEINGTIHQVAHAFYGDYKRADELLRLNPQINQPNFIRQGELLNAYSK